MENKKEELESLISLFLPEGILEYFTISKVEQQGESINIHLEESNIFPPEYINDKLTSKGFLDEIKVQDFPIRGKKVFLVVKRRRWFNETRGNLVMRNWELVAKGTRMTKEFASFLKAISRYPGSKL